MLATLSVVNGQVGKFSPMVNSFIFPGLQPADLSIIRFLSPKKSLDDYAAASGQVGQIALPNMGPLRSPPNNGVSFYVRNTPNLPKNVMYQLLQGFNRQRAATTSAPMPRYRQSRRSSQTPVPRVLQAVEYDDHQKMAFHDFTSSLENLQLASAQPKDLHVVSQIGFHNLASGAAASPRDNSGSFPRDNPGNLEVHSDNQPELGRRQFKKAYQSPAEQSRTRLARAPAHKAGRNGPLFGLPDLRSNGQYGRGTYVGNQWASS
ncbi:hypothetical protein HDE_11873 [Halotydeus destructor]|nr:hypothetical protein HDE_11873 [Halotydeus destructor]